MRRLLVLASVALALGACVQFEETITLAPDLSGNAEIQVSADLEPMVQMMASTQHSLTGKPGAPSAEEVAAVREQMMKDAKPDSVPKLEDLQKQMPPGVQALEARGGQEGSRMVAHVKVAFAKASDLADLYLGSTKSENSRGGVDRPFAGLKVVDEGSTLLITLPLQDMLSNAPGATSGPETTGPFAELFKSLHFSFHLSTPLEVVETNATLRQGTTLTWELGLAELQAGAQHPDQRGLYARLKKKT